MLINEWCLALKIVRIYVLDGNCHLKAVDFKVDLLLLGGWTGRNRDEVLKHIEELTRINVPKPKSVPVLFPVSSYLVDVFNEIEVQSKYTNGEVEYVLFIDGDIRYVTVGSDHTDREIERVSVEKAKQAYPKIIAPTAWHYKDVSGHWDEINLRSIAWINGEGKPYQSSPLKTLITPENLLEIVDKYELSRKGLVIFSGTIPTIKGELLFPESFKIEMDDPVLGRCISYKYKIKVLPSIM